MVTLRKSIKKYCRKCDSHTTQKCSQYKKGKVNPNTQGERRYAIKQRGYGGQTKPIFRKKAKNTKKTAIKQECSQCGQKSIQVRARAKRIIFSNEKKVKGQSLIY